MGNCCLGLRFPKGCIPGNFRAMELRREGGISGMWAMTRQPLVMWLWWCWSLLAASQGDFGCLLNWKHPLQLQPRGATFPQMVLVLWFSIWVIWLIPTSFQTPPGKLGSLLIWGAFLGWVVEAAGLRLVVSGAETMETLETLSHHGFHWHTLWDKESGQTFIGEWSWEIYTFKEVSNVRMGGGGKGL